MAPVTPKAASSIAERIAQRRSSSMPLVPKFVPNRTSGAKPGSPLERLAIIKSGKVPLPARMTPKFVPSAAEIDSSAEKKEIVCTSSREKSTKSVFGDVAEICVLMKPDLLEDVDICSKFFDDVKGIVGPSSFVKHTTEYRSTALLAIMQKTTILVAESMLLDQEDTKAAKEVARTMVAKAYSSTEKVKKLESELATLKGSNISAPTSL